MLLDIILKLNWVDILFVTVLLRTCFVSFKTGFTVESFKLLGILFSIYVSCHYYTALSDVIQKYFPTEKFPLEFLDFLVFLLLVIIADAFFILLRSVFYHFMKLQAVPALNKWGGLVLGLVRAYFLIGLIVFMLIISTLDYLRNSALNSYLGRRFYKVAPNTYTWVWNSITSKFMANEKFNNTITEVQVDAGIVK
ncbi:MAG: CvpA family protein [Candidatus Omnitrophota bacterium]